MNEERLSDIDLYGWRKYSFLPYRDSKSAHPISELVTIQNGCNKFCTFCLVPYTRGREVSRSPQDILEEVTSLAVQGVKEITLLGQNVNAYGRDQKGEISFAQLLRSAGEKQGIERIRFMTSHPSEFGADLVKEMGENPKICAHLHLPLQSGSDRVLENMGRDYDLQKYRSLITDLRKNVPGLSLTTDLIVGFPSESEEDFEATLDALREFEFSDSFSFVYSPRPHTKALRFSKEVVDPGLAQERLVRLQNPSGRYSPEDKSGPCGHGPRSARGGKGKKGRGHAYGKNFNQSHR